MGLPASMRFQNSPIANHPIPQPKKIRKYQRSCGCRKVWWSLRASSISRARGRTTVSNRSRKIAPSSSSNSRSASRTDSIVRLKLSSTRLNSSWIQILSLTSYASALTTSWKTQRIPLLVPSPIKPKAKTLSRRAKLLKSTHDSRKKTKKGA